MTSSVPSTSAGRENYEYRDEFGNLEANLHFVETTRSFAPGLTILEIGCGKGTLLLRLREWGARIVGCEVSDFMLTESRRLHGPLPIAQSDGVNFPYPDDCFDVVLSFDVLEHIPDTDRHLVEVKRVLKPGGCYLLQTPNKWTNTIFETLRWRSFTAWRHDHCSLHSWHQLKRRLRRHGFTVTFYDIPVVNEFFSRKVRHYLGLPGVLGMKLFNPDHLPLPLRTNFYLKATLGAGSETASGHHTSTTRNEHA